METTVTLGEDRLRDLRARKGVRVPREVASLLTASLVLLREYDTHTSGAIRVFRLPSSSASSTMTTQKDMTPLSLSLDAPSYPIVVKGRDLARATEEPLLVEEIDINTHEPVWRLVEDEEVAQSLIDDRKECYAMMWGSCCGGKIDYLQPFKPLL